jgi:hypothetical protein
VHQGQESPLRKLVWVEGQGAAGWGCSECPWMFTPSDPITGESIDETVRKLQTQLYDDFASHACAEHPRVKGAKVAS